MRLLTKYLPVILLLLLTNCQRKTTTAVEESKTARDTKADEKNYYKEAQLEKESNYKKSVNEPAMQRMAGDKAEQLDFKTLYERGNQKHNAGDFQGAIADFSKCITLKPDFPEAYNFRGMSKYKSGDNTGACTDWKKAAELGYSGAQLMIDHYCK